MSATRTQIYLTEEQRRLVDTLSAQEGVTMAEIIRRALDSYLDTRRDPERALRDTFGAVGDIESPDRDDWERG
jgi:hypothetical protein